MTSPTPQRMVRIFTLGAVCVLSLGACSNEDSANSTDDQGSGESTTMPSGDAGSTTGDTASGPVPTGATATGSTGSTNPSAGSTGASGASGAQVDPKVVIEKFVNDIATKSNKMIDERAKQCIFDKLSRDNIELWKAAESTPYLELPVPLRLAMNESIIECVPPEIAAKLPQI